MDIVDNAKEMALNDDIKEFKVIPAVPDGEVKVSVVMPIFNEGEFLENTIGNVLSQTLREIEVICVDDGSTDNSLEILKNFQKMDERVRIVTETNAGPALARNNGLRRVRGEFVAFLDADDIYESTFLEELYSEAKKNDLDIVISDYDIYNSRNDSYERVTPSEHEDIYEPGKVTSKNEHPDGIFLSTNGAAWNKLFKTAFVIEKNLQFLPDVKLYEDVYFVVTALSLAQRVEKVFKTLIHHRIYSEQVRARAFHTHFSQVPTIYSQIKDFLMSHGMYAPLSTSFLNMSASRCYKIYNLVGAEEKEKFWDLLYSEYAEKLGWHGRSAADFENGDVYGFVANIELFDYKQYKRRKEWGLDLPLDKAAPMQTRQKTARTYKKARSFFGRFFGKKKIP